MVHQFEISCKECGAHGFFNPEDHGAIKICFEKGSRSIMDRIVIYCSKCGGKQELGIYWSLDTNAILTKTIHSDSKDNVNKNIGQTLHDMDKM